MSYVCHTDGMKSHASLHVLRITALLAALIALYQMLVGFSLVGDFADHRDVHKMLAFTSMGLLLVGAGAAFVWKRISGNTGLFAHAAGMAVLSIVQIGLGEMHLTVMHQVVGAAYVLGVIALCTLSFRKPHPTPAA